MTSFQFDMCTIVRMCIYRYAALKYVHIVLQNSIVIIAHAQNASVDNSTYSRDVFNGV